MLGGQQQMETRVSASRQWTCTSHRLPLHQATHQHRLTAARQHGRPRTRAARQRVSRRAGSGQAGEHQRRAQSHQQGKTQACGLGGGSHRGHIGHRVDVETGRWRGAKAQGGSDRSVSSRPAGSGQGGGRGSTPAKANGKRRWVPPWGGYRPETGKGVPRRPARPSVVMGVPVRQCVLVGGTGKMKRDPAAR